MTDYLNQYKDEATRPENVCYKYSDRFFEYLLSQCWRNLYQRISTLSALAFAYGLVTHWSIFQMNIKSFKWEDPEFAQRGPGDRTLALCIKANAKWFNLLEDAFGPQAPDQYRSFLKDHEHFKHLVSAAESCIDSKTNPLYTKDSAESFHRFLFAALVMYAVSINKLRRAFQKPVLVAKEEREAIRLAKGFTRILVNVLSSSSFKRHMRLITIDGKFLDCLMANPRNEDAYWKFGQQYGIIRTEPGNVTTTSGHDSGFDVDPAVSRTLQVCLLAPKRYLRADLATELDYLSQLHTFTNWAASLVVQFIGRRALEIQAIQSPNFSLEISVLEVNSITYRMPSWGELLDTVSRALQEGSAGAAEIALVVQALQDHLKTMSPTTLDRNSEAFRTLNQFKTLHLTTHAPWGEISSASFHCEAAMAALSQYSCKFKEWPRNGSDDADSGQLREICKVLNILSFPFSSFDHYYCRI